MTDVSLINNASFEQIAGCYSFSRSARPLIAIAKAKADAMIKFGLIAALSAVSVASTMCATGIAMNLAFN